MIRIPVETLKIYYCYLSWMFKNFGNLDTTRILADLRNERQGINTTPEQARVLTEVTRNNPATRLDTFMEDLLAIVSAPEGEEQDDGAGDISLIDALVKRAKGAWGGAQKPITMNDLRRVLLRPSERAGLAAQLHDAEFVCNTCGREIPDGMMATPRTVNGGRVLNCASCYVPITIACPTCEGATETTRAFQNQAADKRVPCEACKARSEAANRPQAPAQAPQVADQPFPPVEITVGEGVGIRDLEERIFARTLNPTTAPRRRNP